MCFPFFISMTAFLGCTLLGHTAYAQPVAVCKPDTIFLNNNGVATITTVNVDGGSTATSLFFSGGQSSHTYNCTNVGINAVSLIAEDALGNRDTCTTTVTVIDPIPPTPICQNITVSINTAGVVTVPAVAINAGAVDNCGIASISINGQPTANYTCANLGVNPATLTVMDISGNPALCTALITVVDATPPTPICQPVTAYINSNGVATVSAAQIDYMSMDNCGIMTRFINGQLTMIYTCANLGVQSATLAVIDLSGNSASCMATVTVVDTTNTNPVAALCNGGIIPMPLANNDTAVVTPQQISASPLYPCANYSFSPAFFTVADTGYNTVVMTIVGNQGDTATCSALVEVYDQDWVEISGTLYDVSSTGVCNAAGATPLAFAPVLLLPQQLYAYTDAQGMYHFAVPALDTFIIAPLDTQYNFLCPASSIQVVANSFGDYDNNNFYLVNNTGTHDVSVYLWTSPAPRPGQYHQHYLTFCNQGSYTETSGSIHYAMDMHTQFVYSSQPQQTVIHPIGSMPFIEFSDLLPGECRTVVLTVFTPTTVQMGTMTSDCVQISIPAAESNTANNDDCALSMVINSFDPNDKTVFPYADGNPWSGGAIYESDEWLEYTIRFQNTGTAPAIDVVLRDTLDPALIPNSLEQIATSHPCQITIEGGNILVARFNHILLPDSSSDYQASMGFLHFAIRRQAPLPIGTVIANRAAIYFDHNAPVITNTTLSTLTAPVTVMPVANGSVFEAQLYPNPCQTDFMLSYSLDQPASIQMTLFNALGEQIALPLAALPPAVGNQTHHINIAHLPNGVYHLHLSDGNRTAVYPIVVIR